MLGSILSIISLFSIGGTLIKNLGVFTGHP